jgi:hypothetical protein
MNGPDGLTFTGEITSSDAYGTGGPITEGLQLSFSGQWSNGEHGYGSFTDTDSEQFGPQATWSQMKDLLRRQSLRASF